MEPFWWCEAAVQVASRFKVRVGGSRIRLLSGVELQAGRGGWQLRTGREKRPSTPNVTAGVAPPELHVGNDSATSSLRV